MNSTLASTLPKPVAPHVAEKTWRPLLYFNFYRIVLAALFIALFILKPSSSILGKHNADLFVITTIVYFFISVTSNLAIQFRWASFNTLVHALTFVDIAVLAILMHASGGISSGLGMLLLVAITASSLITEGRTANLFAAMAAISVLAEQVYSQLEAQLPTNYTQAGFLGVALFATAILSHVLSKRLHETEAIATQRGIDLANLAQLNEYVIKRLQSGLIVVDENNVIRLMNESAWQMLGLPIVDSQHPIPLSSVSEALALQLQAWKSRGITKMEVIRSTQKSVEVLPLFTRLGDDAHSGTLIFLEDTSRIAQQAQQMKLASLGRLTASIAHEIRNPLGAISHAEQLLAESPQLDSSDLRLTEIIHNNSERVNNIIENVLQLSRRGNAVPEEIQLRHWLETFRDEFILGHTIAREDLEINVDPENIKIYIDSTQLHQIIWNLCQNGLRHSANYPASPLLHLRGRIDEENNHAFLEIVDHGTGIDSETAETIFEPFFTTEKSGSGLGLYISRELCEANYAHLSYIPVPTGGSCFRIDFAASPIN